jgi:restriction system protein
VAFDPDEKITIYGQEVSIFGQPLTMGLFFSESRPSFVRQTLVIRESKVAEGWIIESVSPLWWVFLKELEKDHNAFFRLSDFQLEELIAGYYDETGWKVTLTSQRADGGRDVIAEKEDGRGGVFRVIDQVKKYKPGHLVKADEVRSVMGLLGNHKVAKAYVSTTSDFAPLLKEDEEIKSYLPYRLTLVNGKELRQQLLRVQDKGTP